MLVWGAMHIKSHFDPTLGADLDLSASLYYHEVEQEIDFMTGDSITPDTTTAAPDQGFMNGLSST